ncbi:unnamed protein product [Fusarium venenatum]|uniref:Uncharacterized protein n=1 Tax=Fusarium venenatum TaxID=56646 RepID=A0A2L2TWY2_9HYPO|nr:uncharacterized protein FVRRES_10624 [Fusarium venenatum]CEI70547.1 unnamed protein product [Fusarium venenatum]
MFQSDIIMCLQFTIVKISIGRSLDDTNCSSTQSQTKLAKNTTCIELLSVYPLLCSWFLVNSELEQLEAMLLDTTIYLGVVGVDRDNIRLDRLLPKVHSLNSSEIC